jgi:hypothetical protein
MVPHPSANNAERVGHRVIALLGRINSICGALSIRGEGVFVSAGYWKQETG